MVHVTRSGPKLGLLPVPLRSPLGAVGYQVPSRNSANQFEVGGGDPPYLKLILDYPQPQSFL